ncbi:MAG: hypothetical protein GDA50_01290 [Alphaproteobacteria bacterium GM202ARS2]|nr:hypothetical protein [Alphaproteobacteria bacterium GM202ARS2]
MNVTMKGYFFKGIYGAMAWIVACFAVTSDARADVQVLGKDGWQVTVGGSVNAFGVYSTRGVIEDANVADRTYPGYSGSDGDTFRVQNGLLPAVFGFNVNAPETSDGLQMYARLGLYPHIHNYNREKNKLEQNNQDNQNNIGSTLDLREVFFGVRTPEHGDFVVGKTLGIFLGKNILTDMTLFGVGATGETNKLEGSTSLGRIGYGYVYPNFNVAFRYNSADFRNTRFSVGVYDPSVVRGYSDPRDAGSTEKNIRRTEANNTSEPRLEMEISNDMEVGDVAVNSWINGMYQRTGWQGSHCRNNVVDERIIGREGGTTDAPDDMDTRFIRSARRVLLSAIENDVTDFDGATAILAQTSGRTVDQAKNRYNLKRYNLGLKNSEDPEDLLTENARNLDTAKLRRLLRNDLTEYDPSDDVTEGNTEGNVSYIESLAQNSGCNSNPISWGVGVGMQARYGGLTITGSGYWGRGLGTLLMLDTDALDYYGNPIKHYGYIAQVTYDFGQGTGAGISFGATFASPGGSFDIGFMHDVINTSQVRKRQLFDLMLWHNVNDNVRLVAEYGNAQVEWFDRASADNNLFSFGGFYFF